MSDNDKTPLFDDNGEDSDKKGLKNAGRNFAAWITLLAIFTMLFFFFGANAYPKPKAPIDQQAFWALVDEGKVTSCEIVRQETGAVFLQGKTNTPEKEAFKVNILATETIEKDLRDKGVALTMRNEVNYWRPLLTGFLPLLIGIVFVIFIFRMMKNGPGGAATFGKSRAKMVQDNKKKVTFKNVAGIKEAKEEVEEIIDFLKDPKRFQKLGGKIPRGVLLLGPPGTGKTLLAKAIAGEAKVPFFSISGSDFVEMFVGVGASRVRDMFEQGKKNAPCIVFIDEIDAVGRSRFSGIGGGHDEREQTLNAMLVEMDGFETNDGVIIIAATNRADVLDPALTRPGRFDRQIVIDLPTVDGRLEILKLHAKKIKLGPSCDLRRIARGTPGFSGADLANLLNEAALLAARNNNTEVRHVDLEEARDKVLWGRERRSRAMEDKDRQITAWHEAGHALTQVLCEHTEPLHKVTIIPRGMALGATMILPERDVLNRTRSELLDELVVLAGGRIAEQLHTSDISTGARADIHMASRIARKMVCEYGMSDKLGFQAFGENQEVLFLGREVSRNQEHSEDTAKLIDDEVTRMLKEAYVRCEKIIKENVDKLELLVKHLLEAETMDGRDVEELLTIGRIRTDEEREALDPIPDDARPEVEEEEAREDAEDELDSEDDELETEEEETEDKANP